MLPDIKFSFVELKVAIFHMVLCAISISAIAIITFELEYFTGVEIEALMEYLGLLNGNWLETHTTLFLHFVQVFFIITFIAETKVLIQTLTRDWEL